MLKTLIVFMFLIAFSSTVYGSQDFYHDSRKGWYWYEKNKIEEEPEEEDVEKNATTFTKQDRKKPNIEWDKVWYMHPDDFQALLGEQLKYSVQFPTEKNVTEYVALQYVAQNRAKKFQEVWGDVIVNHPSLDMSLTRNPTKTGSYLEARMLGVDTKDAISSVNAEYGLVLFVSNDCTYCEQQLMYADTFIKKWNWQNFKVINIDESSVNKNKFDVETTPEIFIVDNKGKSDRILAGMQFPDRIENAILNYIHKEKNNGDPYSNPNMINRLLNPEETIEKIDKKYN